MKTKLEILKETLDYYNKDVSRRAINGTGGCEYLTVDGRMCAFGRCEVTPKRSNQDPNCSYILSERFLDNESGMDQSLKEEYQGHSFEFWSDVQSFHDTNSNWNDEGITERGVKIYNNLVLKYS